MGCRTDKREQRNLEKIKQNLDFDVFNATAQQIIGKIMLKKQELLEF